MTNSKSTKRALVSSALAILVCLTMLIGTTFAWFTDTATVGVNTIQAGTLQVDIVDADDETTSLKGETMNFVNSKNESNILWEPGATFKTTSFKIKNIGSLAFKYKLELSGTTADAADNTDLRKVITFSVVNETTGEAVDLDKFEEHLASTDALSDAFYIQGYMDEKAGNDYKGKSIDLDKIGIKVIAAQDTVEFDSNNNTYDEGATYTTEDAAEN